MEEEIIKNSDIEKLLEKGENIETIVHGYSMSPLLKPEKDHVLLTPYRNQKLQKNDVVLFRRINDRLILHRIVKIDDKGTYCLGDNQMEIEGPLSDKQIKAIAYGFKRKGKLLSVNDLSYRLYVFFWTNTVFLRPFIKKAVSFFKTAFRH